jgi:hypothetical protein
VVATGARYRRPEIPNLAQFEGRGVSCWASPVEARLCRNEDVALVGGGNSAGQAAVFLASHARHVRCWCGPGLSSTMSHYLIERIAGSPNIAVLGETEVVELLGTADQGLQAVRWRNRRTGAEGSTLSPTCSSSPAPIRLQPGSTGSGIPIDEGVHPGRCRRAFNRAIAAPAGDRGRRGLRRWRRALRLGEASGAAIGEGPRSSRSCPSSRGRDPAATSATRAEARAADV